MMDWMQGGVVLVISFIGWLTLFTWTRQVFHYCIPLWGIEISHRHLMNVCGATVCIIQAVFTSMCGVIVVTSCHDDVMRATNPLSSWYALVAASYFVYDTLIMYKVNVANLEENGPTTFSKSLASFIKRKPLLIAHHIVSAFFFVPLIIYRDGIGDFFVGCFYCLEFSNPFTNMRIILSRFGLKESKWYLVNGILMIVSFGLCRILVFPYMYLKYGHSFGLNVLGVVRAIPLHCNLGSLLVLLPQIHWLRLMILGAIKLSKGKGITEADEKID